MFLLENSRARIDTALTANLISLPFLALLLPAGYGSVNDLAFIPVKSLEVCGHVGIHPLGQLGFFICQVSPFPDVLLQVEEKYPSSVDVLYQPCISHR